MPLNRWPTLPPLPPPLSPPFSPLTDLCNLSLLPLPLPKLRLKLHCKTPFVPPLHLPNATPFNKLKKCKPVLYSQLPYPTPPMGLTTNDVALPLCPCNLARINYSNAHPNTRKEKEHNRNFSKNLKLSWKQGTKLERRLVEVINTQVNLAGQARLMPKVKRIEKQVPEKVAAEEEKSKTKWTKAQRAAKVPKQTERLGQLGWCNLHFGNCGLRAVASKGKCMRRAG